MLSSDIGKYKGAQVFAVTDALSPLEKNGDGVIVVSAEGASPFPSMTCGWRPFRPWSR